MKARLLDWSELHEGLVIWEEWKNGDGTSRGVVRMVKDKYAILQRGMVSTLIVKGETWIRYWDAEPTAEQREATPWA